MKSITILFYPVMAFVQRLVGAFASSTGIAGIDKAALPDRLNDVSKRMVHDTIAKRSGAY